MVRMLGIGIGGEKGADPKSLHLRRYFSKTVSVSAWVRRCSAHPPCSR